MLPYYFFIICLLIPYYLFPYYFHIIPLLFNLFIISLFFCVPPHGRLWQIWYFDGQAAVYSEDLGVEYDCNKYMKSWCGPPDGDSPQPISAPEVGWLGVERGIFLI